MARRNYWLMKCEREAYDIDRWRKDEVTCWEGVRNYTARNFMRDRMKKGDGMFFYYSGGKPSGIAGVGEIVREGYPDLTAFDPNDVHFDPKSDPSKPVWYRVDVKFVKALERVLPIGLLKMVPNLRHMALFRMSRLSVQPVSEGEWKTIHRMIDARSLAGKDRGA